MRIFRVTETDAHLRLLASQGLVVRPTADRCRRGPSPSVDRDVPRARRPRAGGAAAAGRRPAGPSAGRPARARPRSPGSSPTPSATAPGSCTSRTSTPAGPHRRRRPASAGVRGRSPRAARVPTATTGRPAGSPTRRSPSRCPGAGRRGVRGQPPRAGAVDDAAHLGGGARPLRLSRGLARDGENLAAHWRRWRASEARHFAAEDTRARAGVRVDGAAAGARRRVRSPRPGRRRPVCRVSSGCHTPGTRTPHHGVVTETDPEALPPAARRLHGRGHRRPPQGEELGALLDRRGARAVYAPAIRIVPLSDDAELVAATREVMARPVDLVTPTGVGFRGWLEAADLDLPLVEHLKPARVLARGPRRAARSAAVGWWTRGAGVGVVGGGLPTCCRGRRPRWRTTDRRPAAR